MALLKTTPNQTQRSNQKSTNIQKVVLHNRFIKKYYFKEMLSSLTNNNVISKQSL